MSELNTAYKRLEAALYSLEENALAVSEKWQNEKDSLLSELSLLNKENEGLKNIRLQVSGNIDEVVHELKTLVGK